MKCHNVFNISLLRPFKPTVEGQSYAPPPPVEVDDIGEIWEVNRIVDSRLIRNKLSYLVKWKGFAGTPQATSWEPHSNVEGSQLLLEEFHSSHPDKPSVSSKRMKVRTN